MKRLIPPFALVLLLAACNRNATVTYDLSMNIDREDFRQELIRQSQNVIERQLQSMDAALIDATIVKTDDTVADSSTGSGAAAASGPVRLHVTVDDPGTAAELTDRLTLPFTLDIMVEAEPEEADLTVEGQGSFKQTNVTGTDIFWAQARKEPGSDKGQVRLLFTDQGAQDMAGLLQQAKGKVLGIFVRDRLVSKLNTAGDEFSGDVVISGIPDPEMAQVFADDVNVGLHVTFTQVP